MLKTATISLFMLFISITTTCLAQEDVWIKDIVESFAEQLPDDYDLSELTERLGFYRKYPINLNNTSPNELKNLIFLSPLQISNFFNHLSSNGKLLDTLELQGIDGFDLQTINRLLLFSMLSPPMAITKIGLKNLVLKSNNDLMIRYGQLLQTQKGFKDLPGSRYLGTPEKLLLRYKYSFSDVLAISLVAEKDAGEYLFHGKTGADHLSGNVTLFKLGRIKKLVLGDYSLQFGQGLTLWSGFAFGKGPDVTSVAAKDIGLKAYSSANEASFFRGTATDVQLTKDVNFTPFVSYRKVDASLKSLEDGTATLQNISISGLHRTKTELKNQKSMGQLVYGAAFKYQSNNLGLGIIGYQSHYQHDFTTGTQLYNKYSFTGNKLLNTGIHYNYTHHNIYFYGEAANSIGSGWAFVNGAMASLSSKISAVLLYRDYARNYHSFFASGVGEGTEINNEKGWYAGLNYTPHKYWSFSAYGDFFKFPWLRYRVDSASSGYENLGQATYTPNKTFKILLRYKREIKAQNPDAGSTNTKLENVKKESYRLECNWKPDRKFSFQQRIEVAHYQKGTLKSEIGYMIFQDINYHPLSSKLSGNMRLAYFNTPSYNSRIYAYEDDVLYGSGFGAYHNKGIRSFINIRYRLMRQMDVWTRYAIYWYAGAETIGSGLDEIAGNIKSDVKFQIRYQF